jgi:hypothetical protein
MANTVPMIGIQTSELRWMRLLVSLLRHPDPTVPELTRQALVYLTETATTRDCAQPAPLDHMG